jgi:hypothetical protein
VRIARLKTRTLVDLMQDMSDSIPMSGKAWLHRARVNMAVESLRKAEAALREAEEGFEDE